MEQQLGWAYKWGGVESLGISKVGQTVLARLMESQIWHQLADSVGGGFRKGQRPLLTLMPDPSAFPCIPLAPFTLPPGTGAQRKWVWVGESMCRFFKRIGLGFQQFLPLTQFPGVFCSQKLWGLTFLALESWAVGPGVGLGFLAPKISLQNLFHHMWMWGQLILHPHPSFQSGWTWFLQSHNCQTSIHLDSSWFWVMAVLYFSFNFDVVFEEVSNVCLYHHLDHFKQTIFKLWYCT